jgi:hypothetical protein
LSVYDIAAGDETNERAGVICISLESQLDRETVIENGYQWTIPFAAALWSDKVVSASIEGDQQFATSEELITAIERLKQ